MRKPFMTDTHTPWLRQTSLVSSPSPLVSVCPLVSPVGNQTVQHAGNGAESVKRK